MDRYGHQGNDDSEPEYDVADNLEVHKPHVLARPLTHGTKYAGRFFIASSAFFLCITVTSSNHRVCAGSQCNLTLTEAYLTSSISPKKENIQAQTLNPQLQTLNFTKIRLSKVFRKFSVRSFLLVKCKKGGNCTVPLQAVVGMKATAWMCERREVTLSEYDLLVGLQGHLSAAFHCGRTQLSRSPNGGDGGACSVNRPPLSPAWMWPPASGSLCCTAKA